jgi:three-Cys-motif partner protein
MAARGLRVDTPDELIAAWSKDKLDLLSKYMSAYSKIMRSAKRKWLRSYVYVDAFASIGQYVDRDSRAYVDGSPLVALKCDPPFDRYWFVERSSIRLRRLQQRVSAAAAGPDVRFRQGDANQILADEVIRDVPYHHYQRGLVFLDPYGLQVRWETVRRLAAAQAFDLFMNLSTMGIARLLDKRQVPTGSKRQVLDAIMGEPEWVDRLYASQLGLFGEAQATRSRIPHESIAATYIQMVQQLFQFVSDPVVMKNSKGASLYVLFLASHNRTAIKITNDIFAGYQRLRLTRA